MSNDFAPETDLDAFQTKLKDAIDKDDETKQLGIVVLALGGACLAAIALLVVYCVLKNLAGSYIDTSPAYVNPCEMGAYVPIGGQTCTFIPCAMTTNGQLNPGQFATMEECMQSLGTSFYPRQDKDPASGVVYAYCSTKTDGQEPSGWTGQDQYTTQQLCETDVSAYNKTVVKLGVACDAQKGPMLCAPVQGQCAYASPSVLNNPADITSSNCVYYYGCGGDGKTCATMFATSIQQVYALSPPWTAISVGDCTGANPCDQGNCTGVCMTYDSTKQIAALPGSKVVLQEGGDAVTVTVGQCPSGKTCVSPQDCCDKIKAELGLPDSYNLFPSINVCPTQATTFSCVADPGVSQMSCGPSNCYQLSRDQYSAYPFWTCNPGYNVQSEMGGVAFSSYSNCQTVLGDLNATFLGLYCDPTNGVQTCVQGSSGCTTITDKSILQNVPDYISYGGQNPYYTNSFYPSCILRSSDCDGAPQNCSFSMDSTKSDCSTCKVPGNVCNYPSGTTGWTCSADSVRGITCVADNSSTSLDDACTAAGGSVPCGCGCLAPSQVCVNGYVVGTPCDTMIYTSAGKMPLSYVCGPASMMRSANSWNVQTNTCYDNVPVTGTKPYTMYAAPDMSEALACPLTSDGMTPVSNSNNAVYFLNDPNVAQQTVFPCPYEVYEACHGSSPISAPSSDGTVPYCSYYAFSGLTVQGGLSATSSMCLMNLVDMGNPCNSGTFNNNNCPQNYPGVPVCLSQATDSKGNLNVIVTGCIDPGAPGSVSLASGQTAPISDVVDPQNMCGQCSQSGQIAKSGAAMCPLAPQTNGFALVQDSKGGYCNTLGTWLGDSAVSYDVKTYLTSNIKEPYMVLVPSVYAGIQQGGSEPYLQAAYCTSPPEDSNGFLVQNCQ